MMDFERARRTMVDTQIRVNDVTDARIIEALMAVPREAFVPEHRRALAYLDDDLAVVEAAPGRVARFLIEPMILARMLQAAGMGPESRVLDVGPATGYSTAVLARMAGVVTAVEADPALAAAAKAALADLANVAVVEGALEAGHAAGGPYDAILIEGSVDKVPDALTSQLAPGGRLVAVVGRGRAAKCLVHTRIGDEISARPAFDAAIPPLPGFSAAPGFVF
jgi:protein-L-isoaspartate(D-aspartate) O-methyltransferase